MDQSRASQLQERREDPCSPSSMGAQEKARLRKEPDRAELDAMQDLMKNLMSVDLT